MTDKQIVQSVLDGNTTSFGLLVESYQRPVFSLVYRAVNDRSAASDITQDSFVKAYKKLASFDLEKRFFSWIVAIAMNTTKDWLRKNGRYEQVFVNDTEAVESLAQYGDVQEEMCAVLDAKKVHLAIDELPFLYQQTLILRFREELTIAEISEALGISQSGVKMRISRGLAMIKKKFKGGEYE